MLHHLELAALVARQAELLPEMYGDFDFEAVPHRFTTNPHVESALPAWVARRDPLLADTELVELMWTATRLGDPVADAYASLVPELGMKETIHLLQKACREGIEALEDPPAELVTFIAALEDTPDWVDMDLVTEGARASRVPAAFLSPFVLRGAFLGTFTNTYSALPMTLTGALTSKRAKHRVFETASFFSGTAMPGALDRFGWGFEAAAMVRLMHSMVRHTALTRPGMWDQSVYGLPVPQVDQMPAGLINIYVLSRRALKQGREEFGPRERAVLELTRYRNFLLGLPAELLPTTPRGVVNAFHARGATLRADFDDEICGGLVRSTMEAFLQPSDSLFDRIVDAIEKSWSKFAFTTAFCNGDRKAAAAMSVELTRVDQLRVVLTAPFVLGRFVFATWAGRTKILGRTVDRWATRVLARRLEAYGVPKFTTDAKNYPGTVQPTH